MLHLIDCVGYFAGSEWPLTTGPGSWPPQWPQPTNGWSDAFVLVLDCARLGWGSIERPVRLLIEYHNLARAPDSCLQVLERNLIVNAFWVDDPEVAAKLAPLHLPVQVVNITISDDGTPARTATVSWTPPGFPTSWFQASEIRPFDVAPSDATDRYYWYNATTLYALDLADHNEDEGEGLLASAGELHAPMLYAQKSPTPQYHEPTGILDNYGAEGVVHKFSDFECTNEVALP